MERDKRMTYAQLRKRFPNASASFLRANAADAPADVDRVCATEPQPNRRQALEHPEARPRQSKGRAQGRYRITFRCYRCRPMDWDNTIFKGLQDAIVEAGLLPDDNWRVLEGAVVSDKANSKAEERTEIEIVQLPEEIPCTV